MHEPHSSGVRIITHFVRVEVVMDELLATIKECPFDIVTMSETWLKDNPLRLQYVTIPGYSQVTVTNFGAVALVLT